MKKRVLFAIQGEGRGHMTQAIALKSILEKHNYQVVSAIIGISPQRKIPEFVKKSLNIPIHEVRSPNFLTDKKNKGLDISGSIFKNLAILPRFINSIKAVKKIIKKERPDLIINFYEPLIGLAHLNGKRKYKIISVAHQYLSIHPDFAMPKDFVLEKRALQFFTNLTAKGSDALLGLSFYEMKNFLKKKIYVVPPLLRAEVKSEEISNEGFLLIYLLNKGYKDNILEWHQNNPEIKIHCFIDDSSIDIELAIDKNFKFHQLDGEKFLDKMSKCMGLISTAGFESICEAMYLGKPALMVPVEGHYEQFVNSRDAFSVGAGIYDEHFNIDRLITFIEKGYSRSQVFKSWSEEAENKIVQILDRVSNE